MSDENQVNIEARVEKEIGFVELSGRLVAESRYELERVLREWSEAGVNRVVVSLGNLQYLDSAGLSTLIGGLQRAKRAGGELIVCELNPRLRSMFEITSIGNYLRVCSTESEAAGLLRPSTRKSKESQSKSGSSRGRSEASKSRGRSKPGAGAKSVGKR